MLSNFCQLVRQSLCYPILVPRRCFYDWRTRSDTIFALATTIQPIKGSPLGVIRVSGAQTSQVLCDIVRQQPAANQQVSDPKYVLAAVKPRYATLSRIFDPRDNELVDMGLVLWFPKPNSYTGEDSCELHLHGSRAIINRVLSILGDIDGLRPAEPGEFTRRAVENGKLDLIQAESLPELISAQTDQQRKLALSGLVGSTRDTYDKWTQSLIRILAHLEASIDFGEDELIGEQKVVNECIEQIVKLTRDITNFIAITSRCRDMARSGTRVSILGPPNAGKSTLMNVLCRHEKSIVSNLSGTTRDVIEHTFDLGGHTLAISDTAGLRDLDEIQPQDLDGSDTKQTVIEQHDSIEREGIRRALNAAKEADLIIYLVDGVQLNLTGVTQTIQKLRLVLASVDPERKKIIHVVVNKTDLMARAGLNIDNLTQQLQHELGHNGFSLTSISCRTSENIETLVESLTRSLNDLQAGELETDSKHAMDYVNERHLALLRSTARHLKRAQTLDIRTIDEMAQHVRESVDYLSRIVGAIDSEDVFDVIFRDFCIGK